MDPVTCAPDGLVPSCCQTHAMVAVPSLCLQEYLDRHCKLDWRTATTDSGLLVGSEAACAACLTCLPALQEVGTARRHTLEKTGSCSSRKLGAAAKAADSQRGRACYDCWTICIGMPCTWLLTGMKQQLGLASVTQAARTHIP
jgi:hypothetical protein